MKKATLFLTVAALLLLASCNVDSEHGIYYQVATSQPSSGYNIVHFIHNDGTNLYFLADNGICYTTESKGDTKYVEGSKDLNIRGAYFDGTDFYYSRRVDNTSEIYKLNTATGESEKIPYGKDKLDVSFNGFVYNSDGFYTAGSDSFTDLSISNPRFSGDSMLTMDGTTKAKIYDNGTHTTTEVTGLKASTTGFIEGIDGNYYYIFDGKNIYSLSLSGSLGDAYYSDLDSAPTRGYTAVEYYEGSELRLLVRTAKGFTKINSTDGAKGTLIEKNVQFLSTLNDVVVIDMVYLTDGKIAIVTYANGIYIADMVEKTLSKDIL